MEYMLIASAVVSAVGAVAGGKQQARQFNAYAQANEYNAAVMKQKSDATLAAFGRREEQQRRVSRFMLGQQRAGVAESGLGLGGSNADIERQSEVAAELDALNVRYQGELESKGLLAQSNLESWQSGINRSNSSNSLYAGYMGAAGAALSGAGSYMRYSKSGGGRSYGINE